MSGAGRLVGLPPIVGPGARILILGSFPSEASLAARQYYAHRQNQFWRILGAVIGKPLAEMDYAAKQAAVIAAGIAIWDVYASCERAGSLDAAIRNAEPNDFTRLRNRGASPHPSPGSGPPLVELRPIPRSARDRHFVASCALRAGRGVLRPLPPQSGVLRPPVGGLVGWSAVAIRRVCFNGQTAGRFAPQLAALGYETRILPSTSPANAGLSFERKLEAWREALTL